MDEMHYLYKITNIINRKIYIGQTINPSKRWAGHKNQAKQENPNQLISKAINKYGELNFIFEVIATCKSYEDANFTEELLIQQYDCLAKDGKGYNLSLGGETAPKSDEWCAKMSEVMKQKYASGEMIPTWDRMTPEQQEAWRQKWSIMMTGNQYGLGHEGWTKGLYGEQHPGYGTKRTEEVKQLFSQQKLGNKNPMYGKPAINRGIPMTDEQKEKCRQANLGKHFSPETQFKPGQKAINQRISAETRQQIIEEYKTGQFSRKELANKYQVSPASITSYLKGIKTNRLKGRTWKLIDGKRVVI